MFSTDGNQRSALSSFQERAVLIRPCLVARTRV
jgi:hypothetical protein